MHHVRKYCRRYNGNLTLKNFLIKKYKNDKIYNSLVKMKENSKINKKNFLIKNSQ